MTEFDLTPDPKVLIALTHTPLQPLDALCELVDNAIDSFHVAKLQGNPIAFPLIVVELPGTAEIARGEGVVRVRDNKVGMKLRAVGCVVSRNGVVAGSARTQQKTWLRDFDGWDLPAFCYVDWHPLAAAKPMKGLTQSTIEQVRNEELQREADKLLESTAKKVAYDEEPSPTKDVQDDEIIDHMVSNGFPVLQAEELALALRRVRRLASYYYHRCNWELIKEHETRSFLVVPLLQALGWAEQQMKIEFKVARGSVDLALFSEPFTGHQKQNDACVGLLETKGFPYGLDYVKDQAENYAKELTNCRSLSVTNGFCYKIFQRKSDKTFVLSAYLNVLTPRDRYPLDPRVPGCLEAITQLLPRGLNSGPD